MGLIMGTGAGDGLVFLGGWGVFHLSLFPSSETVPDLFLSLQIINFEPARREKRWGLECGAFPLPRPGLQTLGVGDGRCVCEGRHLS